MTPFYANGLALALGFFALAALAGVGALRLIALARALRQRTDAYATLPVVLYVDRTQRQIGTAMRRIETAPALLYRVRAALREISNARLKMAAILTSPSAIWRLGELFITGR